MDNNDILQSWKVELETKRDELLKKKSIIENRLTKYQVRYEVAKTIADQNKAAITKELETKVKKFQKELDDFISSNEKELTEIEAIIEKIEQ